VEEPHDDRSDDRQRPREPEGARPVTDRAEQRENAHTREGERPAPLVEAERLVLGALLGHEDPGADVGEQPGAAEEDRHHECDAHDDRVDVEVPGDPAGDTGDVPVGDAAAQAAEVLHLVAADAGTGGG